MAYNAYLIVGEQSGWTVPTITGSMVSIIYEFLSNGLKNTGSNPIPARLSGHPSPKKSVQGMFNSEGDIQMELHAEDMVIWWKHLLMDSAVASVDFTEQEVFGDGGGGTKAHSSPESLDTQPSATTPDSSPGQLHVTLALADSGTVTITGLSQGNEPITEVLTFAAETEKTTTAYFQSVDANGIVIATITEAMLIECDRNIWTHTIALGDAVEDGLTIEAVKGEDAIPSVYVGTLLNTGVIDIADIMTATWGCMGMRGWNQYKVSVGAGDPTASTTPTDVSGYTRVSDQVIPGWATSLSIDAVDIDIASGSFSLGNNLAYPTRFRNLRTRPQPKRQGDREISLAVEVDYNTTNPDFDADFLCNSEFALVFYAESLQCLGAKRSITITMPRAELIDFPDPEEGDYLETLSSLNFRPIRSVGASTSDEVVVVIEDTNAEAGL